MLVLLTDFIEVDREELVHPMALLARRHEVVFAALREPILDRLDGMDAEELVTIAQGFWRGLTDGKGLEGLLGFSPTRAISGALDKALSDRPPPAESVDPMGGPPPDEPPFPTNGSPSDRFN